MARELRKLNYWFGIDIPHLRPATCMRNPGRVPITLWPLINFFKIEKYGKKELWDLAISNERVEYSKPVIRWKFETSYKGWVGKI